MNKYLVSLVALAWLISLGSFPSAALAERGSDDNLDVRISERGKDASSTPTTMRVKEADDDDDDDKDDDWRNATSTDEGDDDSETARSVGELRKKIEDRKRELDDDVASTSREKIDLEKNNNSVRLAVHSLLASKELLGGIGPMVSEIAKRVNDSVATTTEAEIKIKSRGLFTRIFFGGDSKAAEIIAREVEQNNERIAELTQLLKDQSLSAEVRELLMAQVSAMQDSQDRLRAISEKEYRQWGFFSWRI